jgi:hypothetical protein
VQFVRAIEFKNLFVRQHEAHDCTHHFPSRRYACILDLDSLCVQARQRLINIKFKLHVISSAILLDGFPRLGLRRAIETLMFPNPPGLPVLGSSSPRCINIEE